MSSRLLNRTFTKHFYFTHNSLKWSIYFLLSSLCWMLKLGLQVCVVVKVVFLVNWLPTEEALNATNLAIHTNRRLFIKESITLIRMICVFFEHVSLNFSLYADSFKEEISCLKNPTMIYFPKVICFSTPLLIFLYFYVI